MVCLYIFKRFGCVVLGVCGELKEIKNSLLTVNFAIGRGEPLKVLKQRRSNDDFLP